MFFIDEVVYVVAILPIESPLLRITTGTRIKTH